MQNQETVPPLPDAARALLCAVLTALVSDALLTGVTGLADVTARGGGPSWEWAGQWLAWGRWVIVALLLVAVGGRPVPAVDRAAVWRWVGLAVTIAPLVWILAGWLAQAALFTAAGRWDVDGQMFLSGGLYRRAFVDYVPWLLGGVTTRAVAAHLR